MIKKIAVIVVVMLVTITSIFSIASAEEKKMTSEEQQQMVQQQMQMMGPMFGQMMKAMMEAELDVLSNPATADKLASFTKNYYDALIKKGFSKEEALHIAMAVGVPSLGTMQK